MSSAWKLRRNQRINNSSPVWCSDCKVTKEVVIRPLSWAYLKALKVPAGPQVRLIAAQLRCLPHFCPAHHGINVTCRVSHLTCTSRDPQIPQIDLQAPLSLNFNRSRHHKIHPSKFYPETSIFSHVGNWLMLKKHMKMMVVSREKTGSLKR